MGRKETDTVTVSIWLTVREGLIVDEMRALAALDSKANLVRAALFFYAKHLDVPNLHFSDFGIRMKGRDPRPAGRKVKTPDQVRRKYFPAPTCASDCVDCADDQVAKPKRPRNTPAPDHPWRRRLVGKDPTD